MPQVTLGQLQSRGFQRIDDSDPRWKLYTGAALDGSSLMVWWDQTTQRAYTVNPQPMTATDSARALLGIAATLDAVIQALPLAVLDAPTKAGLRSDLLNAMRDTVLT